MNNITIAGNVGKSAEIRSTQNGDKLAGFSVAVDNGKDANGMRFEDARAQLERYEATLEAKGGE